MKKATRILSAAMIIFAGIVEMAGETQNVIALTLLAIWMLLASDRM